LPGIDLGGIAYKILDILFVAVIARKINVMAAMNEKGLY
jgi:hypothetical protein